MLVEKSSTSPKIVGRLLCIGVCRRRVGSRALKESVAQVGGIARNRCFEREVTVQVGCMSGEAVWLYATPKPLKPVLILYL